MKWALVSLPLPPNLDSNFERLKHTSTGSHQQPQKPSQLVLRWGLQVKPSHGCRQLKACPKCDCSAGGHMGGQTLHNICCKRACLALIS